MPNGKKYEHSAELPQRAFHKSKAKFRWLGGGVGGGKSAASTVEVLRHSWEFPNNYGFILRKTFPELRLSAIKDFYEICPSWMIVEDNRQEHWVDVYNHIGFRYRKRYYKDYKNKKMTRRDYIHGLKKLKGTSRIEFISFEGTEAAEDKFRSANIGWYMMEQAEEAGDTTIYNRLNERLRRVPSYRQAWFISNPDGRDWLWDIFSEDSEGKRENHEMFEFQLTSNTNLPEDFHQSLKDTYTAEDYARLVEGSFDVATGAVFPEFSFDMHVVDHFDPPDFWEKGLSLDHGLNNPTGAIHMTKFPTGEVYIYEEYYEQEKFIAEHAAAFRKQITPEHRFFTIDPLCVNRSAINGATIIGEYARAGIPFQPGVRDVMVGINRIKEYLDFDVEHPHPILKTQGSPRFFVSDRCPILIRQLQRYKRETLKTNRGMQNQPEKMRKHFDHLIDPIRWLMLIFTPHRSQKSYVPELARNRTFGIKAKEDKISGIDEKNYDNPVVDISSMIKDASRQHDSRTTIWR